MTALEVLFVLLAGTGAGAINAVVGSGTLITFPVLLAVGFPPIVANVSNSIGLVPGSVAGAIGYRELLVGQAGRVRRLGLVGLAGGTAGALALLVSTPGVFEAIVPVFIAAALVLIVVQPKLSVWLQRRRGGAPGREDSPWLALGMGLASAYGGYFGAAQGIIYMGILSNALRDDLQRLNGLKNVLAAVVNAVAGVVFIVAADPSWAAVGAIAAGSAVGGQLGARYGKRLPPDALRAIIVVVGLAAIVNLLA